jgi:hypothetical protein
VPDAPTVAQHEALKRELADIRKLLFRSAADSVGHARRHANSDHLEAVNREDLVGHWTKDAVKTDIGTAFVDVYAAAGEAGLPVKVDFAGKTRYAAKIQWNKIGAGTQNVRAVDADNVANVLFDVVVVDGENDVALATLPAFATGVKRIKLQAKSTTATDDPIFRGCCLLLK